jgi:hypothetical protein
MMSRFSMTEVKGKGLFFNILCLNIQHIFTITILQNGLLDGRWFFKSGTFLAKLILGTDIRHFLSYHTRMLLSGIYKCFGFHLNTCGNGNSVPFLSNGYVTSVK